MTDIVERLRKYSLRSGYAKYCHEAADEIESLRKSLRLLQQHNATAWQRGHTTGSASVNTVVKQAEAAKQSYLDENERMSNVLVDLDRKIESLQTEVEQYRQEWIDCSIKLENLRNGVDCSTCANKGEVYGLTQETYCEHCVWSDRWRKNMYKPKE